MLSSASFIVSKGTIHLVVLTKPQVVDEGLNVKLPRHSVEPNVAREYSDLSIEHALTKSQ